MKVLHEYFSVNNIFKTIFILPLNKKNNQYIFKSAPSIYRMR
jgi:hypothetical protein